MMRYEYDVVGIGDRKGCSAAGAAAPNGTMIPWLSLGLEQRGGWKKTFQHNGTILCGSKATRPCPLLDQPKVELMIYIFEQMTVVIFLAPALIAKYMGIPWNVRQLLPLLGQSQVPC